MAIRIEAPPADIRSVTIKPRGPVARAEANDLEGGIIAALEAHGTDALFAGTHRLIALDATVPHHPTAKHIVYWMDQPNETQITPWSTDSWIQVAEDALFLQGVERFVQERRAISGNELARFYFFMGFVPRDHQVDTSVAFKRALQSQFRAHIHEVPPAAVTQTDPILDSTHPNDYELIRISFKFSCWSKH